jgi:uncharacterized damage-inducible protein DinB
MKGTRTTLERVPDSHLDWKPHAKSWPMGGLATHLTQIPNWAARTLQADSFDIAPLLQAPPRVEAKRSRAELLAAFHPTGAAARSALAAAPDAQLRAPWSLLKGGQKVFTLPRISALRSFVMNHLIHHRAQLGVYLRLLDVPVPALYGPSADEGTL